MTFEDYLKQLHAKDYTGIDDDMPDDYEHWLDEQMSEIENIFRLADEYKKTL